MTARNWTLVDEDTAAIKRFDYVDFLYGDVDFHRDDINNLNETIRKRFDIMMEKKRKKL